MGGLEQAGKGRGGKEPPGSLALCPGVQGPGCNCCCLGSHLPDPGHRHGCAHRLGAPGFPLPSGSRPSASSWLTSPKAELPWGEGGEEDSAQLRAPTTWSRSGPQWTFVL